MTWKEREMTQRLRFAVIARFRRNRGNHSAKILDCFATLAMTYNSVSQ